MSARERAAYVTTTVVPVTRAQVKEFVRAHHRHGPTPPAADVLRAGLMVDGQLVAVAMAGTPSTPSLMDGRTLEVTRCAVAGYVPNACSQLYGALWRAAKALGWERMVTYTRADESGSSLRAVGWVPEARLPARNRVGWDNRPGRQAAVEPVERVRWVVRATPQKSDADLPPQCDGRCDDGRAVCTLWHGPR